MAAPVGATVGLRGCGLNSSEIFPSDTFDFRQIQEQLDFPDMVVPGWFGHGLPLPPDSGVDLGSTERTGGTGAARHEYAPADDPAPGSTETTGWGSDDHGF